MKPIYLDHAATTPVRDEVREAMAAFAGDNFGNPSSLHSWGRTARAALERARADVAEALGARPSEIHFVRGGTESDNMAVAGSVAAQHRDDSTPTLVVSNVEHSAVLECAEHLSEVGLARMVVTAVSPTGAVDVASLADVAASGPCTVSVMWVNNETGLVLPVPDIVEALGPTGAVVHTDASQALGKVPVSVRDTSVDLLTATGHKINGPKGVGILFVREGTPLRPLLHGGGQERALRPGTEDVGGAVGLATAIRLAVDERADLEKRLTTLRADFERDVRSAVSGIRVNCAEGPRAPHVSSIGVAGVADSESLLMAFDLEGVAVSGGSACHSGAGKGSHVIEALYGADDDHATVRFSLGRTTVAEEMTRAVHVTRLLVERLRTLAPA